MKSELVMMHCEDDGGKQIFKLQHFQLIIGEFVSFTLDLAVIYHKCNFCV